MHLKEWGLATLSFDRYNMAQGFLGRSCFKSFNIIKKQPLKNFKIPKFFFVRHDIFFKKTFSKFWAELFCFTYDNDYYVHKNFKEN